MQTAIATLRSSMAQQLAASEAPSVHQWLAQLSAALQAQPSIDALQRLFANASRQLKPANTLPAQLGPALRQAGIVNWQHWQAGDIGRLLLLLQALEPYDAVQAMALLTRLYRGGDPGEQQSLLRALPLLPQPANYLAIGIDACRSHIQGCFEAIACENTYPAAYFPEPNFNQLVLKALFIGTPVQRIHQLQPRLSPQLLQMVADYASERRATLRDVSADTRLLLKGSHHENV